MLSWTFFVYFPVFIGSPFQFTVGKPADGGAEKVRVSGQGLQYGIVDERNEFSIYTREAGAGGLSIAIEGPSKAEIFFEVIFFILYSIISKRFIIIRAFWCAKTLVLVVRLNIFTIHVHSSKCIINSRLNNLIRLFDWYWFTFVNIFPDNLPNDTVGVVHLTHFLIFHTVDLLLTKNMFLGYRHGRVWNIS